VILYIDTSSLVKLYVEEAGSDDVRGFAEAASAVTTSQVAYAEARAALARRRRERALSPRSFAAAKRAFEADWERYVVVAVTRALCREAGELAERYRLRGYDAIHLASFSEVLRDIQGRSDVRFSSFDAGLNRAARRLSRTIG
jgi:predicted nucleic acid-binding protein